MSDSWVEVAMAYYSMHGHGLLRNILSGVAGIIAATHEPAELSESDRFQVEEARRMLADVWADRLGEEIYGIERTLHDHARNLLALVDRIAPEGEAGE